MKTLVFGAAMLASLALPALAHAQTCQEWPSDDFAGCFIADPCGRTTSTQVPLCGTYTTQDANDNTVVVNCPATCPESNQQCGGLTVVYELGGGGGSFVNQPNECFVSCASQGVQCGTIEAEISSSFVYGTGIELVCSPAADPDNGTNWTCANPSQFCDVLEDQASGAQPGVCVNVTGPSAPAVPALALFPLAGALAGIGAWSGRRRQR